MRYLMVLVALAGPLSASVRAQSFYTECPDNTGESASIILRDAIAPTIDGRPIVENSEIAVFTQDGECAGMAIWTGSSLSITAWGDDIMTAGKDGYASEEVVSFRVWDASSGVEYGAGEGSVAIEYDSTEPFVRSDGRYANGAIITLAALHAKNGALPEVPAAPSILFPEDGTKDVDVTVAFEWLEVEGASAYRVQILVDEGSDSARTVIDTTGVQGTTLSADLDAGARYHWRVRAAVNTVWGEWSRLISFETRVRENPSPADNPLPDTPELDQNYPNPFNPHTTIPFVLPEAGQARLTVYDMLGKEVAVLADGMLQEGEHAVRWNAENIPSGVFTYVLRTSTATLRRSLVLVK